MKISESQLEEMYLKTEHGTFTPIYAYEKYIIPTDKMNGSIKLEPIYEGLVIHKTAQEVYDEWLANKDKPSIEMPTTEEQIQILQEKLAEQEQQLILQEETTLDIDYRVTCIELGI